MNSPVNYQTIVHDLITSRRLSSYRNVFNTKNEEDLVAVYLWNIDLCSSIYSLLNIAEVSLRNSIDNAFIRKHGKFWWRHRSLKYLSFSPGSQPPKVIINIQKKFSDAAISVKGDKAQRYNLVFARVKPLHEDIIAKTDFSVWEDVLDSEFMGDNLVWPSQLGSAFKGQWGTSQAKRFLADTKDLVKSVRLLRNRVSHHEPIWKKSNIADEAAALQYINEVIDKILKLIELIDPEMTRLIDDNEISLHARNLASPDVLNTYRTKHNDH